MATEASLNRRVVIKLLPPDLAIEVSAARFKQEMEFAARLQRLQDLDNELEAYNQDKRAAQLASLDARVAVRAND